MSYDPTDQSADRSDPIDAEAPSMEDVPAGGDPFGGTLPPPPGPPAPLRRQLVRDPYTRLGGVASGLSHHYGIDVSLIRLAFVVTTLFSGFGLVTYLLAWMIIPRAQYWPPAGGRPYSRSLTSREIGIGLLGLGAAIALFVGGGALSEVLIPLLLVIGGIWLLTQPSEDQAPSLDQRRGQVVDTVQPDAGPAPVGAPLGEAVGAPVPPARKRRRVLVVGGLLLLALPLLALAGAIIAFVGLDVGAAGSVTYRPSTAAEIPDSTLRDSGELIIDLTELDSSMFSGGTERLDVNMDFGSVQVLVPSDLAVEVHSAAGLGDIRVFDRRAEGVRPDVRVDELDPDVILDLSVGLGEIRVERR